jgi:hypothetical protein
VAIKKPGWMGPGLDLKIQKIFYPVISDETAMTMTADRFADTDNFFISL